MFEKVFTNYCLTFFTFSFIQLLNSLIKQVEAYMMPPCLKIRVADIDSF